MKTYLIKGIRFYQKYLSPLKRVHCPYKRRPARSTGWKRFRNMVVFKGSLLALWWR